MHTSGSYSHTHSHKYTACDEETCVSHRRSFGEESTSVRPYGRDVSGQADVSERQVNVNAILTLQISHCQVDNLNFSITEKQVTDANPSSKTFIIIIITTETM